MAYAQLGDVTTSTGGGASIASQIYSWFTGSVADAANEPQVVLDWEADVRSRGNAVVRYPKTDDVGTAGDLAERETLSGGGYSYYMAPPEVIAADRTNRGLSQLAPATAKIAALGEGLTQPLADIGKDVTKIAIIAGVAVVALNVLP